MKYCGSGSRMTVLGERYPSSVDYQNPSGSECIKKPIGFKFCSTLRWDRMVAATGE